MDRLSFLNNIKINSEIDPILSFDECMLLYDIINNNLEVIAIDRQENSQSYEVICGSNYQASDIENRINNTLHTKYDNLFEIIAKSKSNILNIRIIKRDMV